MERINLKHKTNTVHIRSMLLRFLITTCILMSAQGTVLAQQNLESEVEVQPMGNWVEFRQTTFNGNPILVHLRQGYERAVLMPEPVRLQNPEDLLPGCEVIVEGDVIGFYPTRTFFPRVPIRLVGLDSGDTYELRVRASSSGIRQPLQILRP